MEEDMEMDDSQEEHHQEEHHKKHEHKGHEHEHSKKHAHNKEYMEHKEHKHAKTYETATWTLGVVAVVLAIALIAAIVTKGFSGTSSGTSTSVANAISQNELRAKAQTYLEKVVQGQNVTIGEIKDVGDMYSIKLDIGGRPYDSYVRKDGSLLFPSGLNMNEDVAAQAAAQPAAADVPKTDKPVVELFVMAYCPYGTQAEKGILPAVKVLGDSIDFKIRFVYYAMHGLKEVKENLNQYCIQSEQPDKYLAYLACFLNDSAGQGSDATVTACIASTGIDTKKLETCKTATDAKFNVMKNYNDQASWLSGQFPKMDMDAALNTKYGIGGSPTLVINGVQSNAGRDSASYLAAICNAMTTPVPACSTQLSSVNPGPGFGYDSTAAATAAGCGV
jgi:hypothetical protein